MDRPHPTLEEVVVLSLAASRLARAISTDDVSRPVRERVERWAGEPSAGPSRRWLSDLLHCPVCTGWWTSLALSVVSPGPHRLRRGLAVAGGQVLFTLLERLVSEQGRAAVHEARLVEVEADAITADPTAG